MASAWGASWGAAWGAAWGLLLPGYASPPAGAGPTLRPATGQRAASLGGMRPEEIATRRALPADSTRPPVSVIERHEDAASQRMTAASVSREATMNTCRPSATGGLRPTN